MVRYLVLLIVLNMGFSTFADAAPAKFYYQGQIIKPDSQPLEGSNVTFLVEILSPNAEACLLFQESHTINMNGSNGLFSLEVGSGTRVGTDYEDTNPLATALSNFTGLVTPTTCDSVGSYNPSGSDGRKLRITFDDGTGPTTIAQDHNIVSVPYAANASSIDGLSVSDLVRINNGGGVVLTQSNLESVFGSAAMVTELLALINGTSTQYSSGTPTSDVDMNSQKVVNVATPTAATDAANKDYADDNVGGRAVDTTTVDALGAGQSGQVLTWNGTEWTSSAPSGDSTKLPLAGGTMSGTLNMGNQDVSNIKDVAVNNDVTVGNDLTVTNNVSITGGIGVGTGINSNGTITVENQNIIRFGDADSASLVDIDYVGFRAPAAITAPGTIWTLPAADGTAGQILSTDGSGVLSWVSDSAPIATVFGRTGTITAATSDYDAIQVDNTAAGSISATNVQAAINELDSEKVAKSGDQMTGALQLNATNEVRFADADSSNYVGFASPGIVGSNQIWVLPNVDGNSGEYLQTDGSGQLTFAPAPTAPVTSVYGRTGVVTAATSDYDAIQVDNTAAGTISATNVQAAINELDTEKVATTRTLTTAADSGLAGGGDLSANRSLSLDIPGTTDLGAPAVGADSLLIYDDSGAVIREVTRTQLVLSESEVDAFVGNNGYAADADKVNRAGDTMTGDLNLDNEQEVRFSEADGNGTNYVGFKAANALAADQIWTLPIADGTSGQVLQTDGSGNLSFVAIAAAPVTSVYGRTGVVTAATSDYDAVQVDNTAAGTISATNVQAAINELDTEKVATTRTLSTAADSGLAGGGDLSANRSLSLDIPGTTDLGAPAVGADSLLIYDDSGAVIREVTRTQLVLSEAEVDAFVGNNGYAADADKVNRAGDIMTGDLNLDNEQEVRFSEADGNGANYVGFKAANTLAADQIWTLPVTDGASGQVLQTDGSGNLSFVAIASAPVDTVFGRTGTVVAAASDYDAVQVDNIAAGTISATNVQAAINELDTEKVATTRTLATAADSGLAGGGDLSANRSLSLDIPGTTDLGAPAVGADSLLIYDASGTVIREVTRTQLVLSESEVDAFVGNNGYAADADKVDRAGDAMTGNLTMNATTEVRFADADSSNYVGFASPAIVGSDQIWTLPASDGTSGQVLQTDGSGNLSFVPIAAAPVTSVYGRTGVVTAATSDYDAIQVDNTAAGTISATNVQAAINELDTEKVATTRTLSTAANSGLAGGGDLSANRSLSLDIPGTTDLGAPAVGADSLLIYDASGTVIREVTRTQLVLSESEVDSFVANNGYAADADKVDRAGDTMTGDLNLDNEQEVRFSEADVNGTNYVGFKSASALAANQIWTLPAADGASGQVLQTDGSGNLSFVAIASAPVASVYGRTGVVTAATSDYDAIQVDNTAAGTISATNVQAAINELDTEKVATTRTLSTAANSGLAGGGDLSANRALSLDIPGTTDLGAPAVGADSLLIYDASGTAIREVTRTQLVLSESEVDSFVANNGFAADADKVDRAGDTMTGDLNLDNEQEVRFSEADVNGTNYVGFKSASALAANQIWTLPAADGASGQVLQTDGSGNLSFVAIASAPVASVYGRTGAVVAATSDYDAIQVDNTAAGTISATNVQSAINELDTEKVATTRTLATAADSGLTGGGDLSANRSLSLDIPGTTDLGAPAVGADSLLIYDASGTVIREVTRTQLVLSESEVDAFVGNNGYAADADKVDRSGDAMTGNLTMNATTEVRFADADSSNYVGFASPAIVSSDQIWTLPASDGTSGQVLQTDGSGNLSFVAIASAPVASVYGRTGAVVAATSDYDAIQVDNTAAGTISATNVQAAINELDTEKVATTRTLATAADSGLTGGGDLSANRSLSLDIPGTTDLGAPAVGADSLLLYDASGTAIREVTRTQLVLSESEVDAFVANNGFAADADKVDRAGDTMTGDLNLDNEQEVRFSEADGNGTNYVGFKSASALAASQIWTLPVADGTSGQVLQTDGSGNLSFVAIASAPVASVYGRTGAVVAATSDYDAVQVDNTAAGTISATNVQAAINELDTEKVATTRTLATAADSGLTGGGDLSANRTLSLDIPGTTDLGGPAVGADSLLLYDASGTVIREVTRTQLVLSESEVDSFVSNNGYAADADKVDRAGDTMTGDLNLDNEQEVRFSEADVNGTNYVGFKSASTLATSQIWTLPVADGTSGQVLQTDGSGNLSFVAVASAPVASVYGRTGAVVAATSDYDAIQVDYTAAGTISATNVQAAINELDTEKVATTRTLATAADSGLTGGGDLSANRTLSLDIPGTTDLGAPADGADSLLIYDASGTAIREVTRTQLVLSESEVDAFVGNNGYAADADKVNRSGDAMTGNLTMNATTEVRFADADSSNYVGFASPAIVGADQIWTLPASDGTSGQVLQTNGSGLLSWSTPSSGASSLNELSDVTVSDTNYLFGTDTGTGGSITTGVKNVAIGKDVLKSSNGDGNIAIGWESMRSATSGLNVAIGSRALRNSTGGDSVAIGHNASLSTTSGQRSIGIGSNALAGNETGSNGVGIGYYALGEGTDRGNSIGIGYEALRGAAGNTANNNIGIGRSVAATVVGATNNIVIGNYAGGDLIDGTNNILIGDNAEMGGADLSNYLNIGNTITGNISTGDVAIDNELRLNDADDSNYVGFVSPAIVGTDVIWTLPSVDGSAGQVLQTNGSGLLTWASVGGSYSAGDTILAADGTSGAPGFGFNSDSTNGMFLPSADTLAFTTGGSEKFRVSSSGDMTIGDTNTGNADLLVRRNDEDVNIRTTLRSPTVDRTASIESFVYDNGTNSVPIFRGVRYSGTSGTPGAAASGDELASFEAQGGTGVGYNYGMGGKIEIFAAENFTGAANGSTMRFSTAAIGESSASERMRIHSNGNVGIGASTPNEKLTVEGGMSFKEMTAPTTDVATYHKLYVDAADNKLKFRDEAGTVTDLLAGGGGGGDFMADGSVVMSDQLLGVAGAVDAPSFTFDGNSTSGLWSPGANTVALSTNSLERLRINSAGNVGIGTNNPGVELDVNTGTINAARICDENNANCKDISVGWTSGADIDGLADASTDYISHTVFLGSGSGASVTSAVRSAAVGEGALASLTSATDTVAIGYNALNALTSQSSSTAVGSEALAVSDGANNTAVGTNAGKGITGLNWNNSMLGTGAMSNGTGSHNVALGSGALWNVGTGADENTAVGVDTLGGINGGDQNVAVGKGAGQSSWSNANRNVFLGYESGKNITTADNNIMLGYQAGDLTTSGDNNIIIGHGIDASSATASNELNIGGAIFGNLSTGNVGIGTATPAEMLHVQGNVQATAYFYNSDRRLKKNIRPLDGLGIILNLSGVSYEWKENGNPEIGLIAQEVEKVLPELVSTHPTTNLKAVKYGNLVAPLIESTKDLYGICTENGERVFKIQKTVETNSRDLARVKDEVEKQNEQITELKNQVKELREENRLFKQSLSEIRELLSKQQQKTQ